MAVLVNDNEIVLSGTVGYDFWDDCFTAGEVTGALAQVGRARDVTIRLNSGGGFATEGAAIHAALQAHKGKVTVIVEGIAASAASLIAVAGDLVQMALGSVMMIHDPATMTWGTAQEHKRSLDMLTALGDAYAGTYADKTGGTIEAMRALMQAETWMTAQEAVDQKFADSLAAANSNTPEPTAFAYGVYAHAPAQIVALADTKGWNARGPQLAANRPASLPQAAKPAAQSAAPAAPTGKQEPTMADENEETVRADERTKATARIKAIMTSDEAKGREPMAQHLAYETQQGAEDAVALLKMAPQAQAPESAADDAAAFAARKATAAEGMGGPAGQVGSEGGAKAAWGKAVAKVNKRVPGAR